MVEDSGLPSGYDPAPDQYANVGLGSSPGQGQTFNLTFIDPRKHRVIVLVCHEGTDSLAPSDVTIDNVEKTSLAKGQLDGRPGEGAL